MKTKIKYVTVILICFLLTAVMVTVNYSDYKSGKKLIEEELYPERNMAYAERWVSSTETTETININTASAEELAAFLPGIGEKKAESIVAYRNAIGGFKSVDELIEVSGIGEATLDAIRDYCRISD